VCGPSCTTLDGWCRRGAGFEDVRSAHGHDTRVLTERPGLKLQNSAPQNSASSLLSGWNLSPLLSSVITNHHAPQRSAAPIARWWTSWQPARQAGGKALEKEPHPNTSDLMKAAPLRIDRGRVHGDHSVHRRRHRSAPSTRPTESPKLKPRGSQPSGAGRRARWHRPTKAVDLKVGLLPLEWQRCPCQAPTCRATNCFLSGRSTFAENTHDRRSTWKREKQNPRLWAVVASCEAEGDANRD